MCTVWLGGACQNRTAALLSPFTYGIVVTDAAITKRALMLLLFRAIAIAAATSLAKFAV